MTTKRISLREDKRSRPRMEMTALIDCVFLLLIFFLLTSSFVNTQQLELELTPLASGEPDTAERSVLTFSINEKGAYFLDGNPITEQALDEKLMAQAVLDPKTPLRLLADRQAPAGKLLHLVDATRMAGLERLELSGELKPEEPSAP